MSNIVLIGMPGAGKTTIGRKLHKLLDRPVLDSDDQVIKETGRSVKDLFQEGEDVFRAAETAAIKTLSEMDGIIISCRLKPHNAFRGTHESGPCKMMTVGLGKHCVFAAKRQDFFPEPGSGSHCRFGGQDFPAPAQFRRGPADAAVSGTYAPVSQIQ